MFQDFRCPANPCPSVLPPPSAFTELLPSTILRQASQPTIFLPIQAAYKRSPNRFMQEVPTSIGAQSGGENGNSFEGRWRAHERHDKRAANLKFRRTRYASAGRVCARWNRMIAAAWFFITSAVRCSHGAGTNVILLQATFAMLRAPPLVSYMYASSFCQARYIRSGCLLCLSTYSTCETERCR